jgi:hypothetical protein
MAFLAPDVDLAELWKERSNLPDFKERDQRYKVHENVYRGRSPDGKQANITWRPIMLDGDYTAGENREALNLAKQIGLHHQASFARPPRVWNSPPDDPGLGHRNTAVIDQVERVSKIRLLQARQSYYLAVLGDAVYGVGYDTDTKAQDRIWVRGMDPSRCYPGMDDEQIGVCRDLLITYEVRRGWAEREYGIKLPEGKSHVRFFEYWDDEYRLVQIENRKLGEPWKLHHKLGFTPWHWCFNQGAGQMAQADVAETPKLQELLNDLLVLTLDATRRNIDKSYIGIGVKGELSPRPGKIIGIANPQARVEALETAVPPAMLIQVMGVLQNHAQSMAGISPISSEGMASGSIVTGSAIRHQVEAIEARMETKRAVLEAVYAWLGSSVLRVFAAKFKSTELRLAVGGQVIGHKGGDVGNWYDCEAAYGGFDGMPASERGQWALQGLGRLHGQRTAIRLAYPDADPQAMGQEIDDYQLQQAILAAKGQHAAQAVLASGQEQGPAPGGPGAGPSGAPSDGAGPAPPSPQVPQRPPIPGMSNLGKPATLGDLRLSLRLVASQLRGDVYAVGEIAITGMSIAPQAAVTREQDRATVTAALGPHRVTVKIGLEEDEPKVRLNDD